MKILSANRIQYHSQYISIYLDQIFLVNLTTPNKQFPRVKSEFKCRDLYLIYKKKKKSFLLGGV